LHPTHTVPLDRDALLALDDEALAGKCRIDAFRGSGPGGQKRNKTSSGIRVTHEPTGCFAVATVKRSQHDNLRDALRSLRLEIAFTVRRDVAPDAQVPTATPKMASYPAAVATLFDVLEASGWSLADAAAALGTTTGQIAAWLTDDPIVLAAANRERKRRSLRTLQPRD
jgi:hypothetical protein